MPNYTAQSGTEAVFRFAPPVFGSQPTVVWYRNGNRLSISNPGAELRVTAGSGGHSNGARYHATATGPLKGSDTVYRYTTVVATLTVVSAVQTPAIQSPASGAVLDKYNDSSQGPDWVTHQLRARGQGLTWTVRGDNGFEQELVRGEDLQVASFDTRHLQDATRVTVTVVDPQGRRASRSWNFRNAPPIANNRSIDVYPSLTYTQQLPGTDPEGDTLTYSLRSGPGQGNVVVRPDGSYTYTAVSVDPPRVTSFVYRVSDGQATDDGTITIRYQSPDLNKDGVVDAQDYTILNANFGQEVP